MSALELLKKAHIRFVVPLQQNMTWYIKKKIQTLVIMLIYKILV